MPPITLPSFLFMKLPDFLLRHWGQHFSGFQGEVIVLSQCYVCDSGTLNILKTSQHWLRLRILILSAAPHLSPLPQHIFYLYPSSPQSHPAFFLHLRIYPNVCCSSLLLCKPPSPTSLASASPGTPSLHLNSSGRSYIFLRSLTSTPASPAANPSLPPPPL